MELQSNNGLLFRPTPPPVLHDQIKQKRTQKSTIDYTLLLRKIKRKIIIRLFQVTRRRLPAYGGMDTDFPSSLTSSSLKRVLPTRRLPGMRHNCFTVKR